MGENSKIEWTDHTFNPWIGCTKVSAACKNCYAEVETFTRVQRSKGRELWGIDAERHRTGADNWRKPKRWNDQAKAEGVRRRVFCASMADVFEDHPAIMPGWRADLGEMILKTPNLDWLLLTKRPENIYRMLPDFWINFSEPYRMPSNVWIGTTVENQEEADRRIPELLKIPAAVRFLSCEPLLGPIDLRHVQYDGIVEIDALAGDHGVICPLAGRSDAKIHWVICGGESGPNARPMHPAWARSLRDQCKRAGVAFHFKQWGAWSEEMFSDEHAAIPDSRAFAFEDDLPMVRVGKHSAGRLLDGRTWDEWPILTA